LEKALGVADELLLEYLLPSDQRPLSAVIRIAACGRNSGTTMSMMRLASSKSASFSSIKQAANPSLGGSGIS